MSVFILYLIEALPDLAKAVIMLSVLGLIVSGLFGIASACLYVQESANCSDKEELAPAKFWRNVLLGGFVPLFLILILAGNAVPSSESMYRIVGGYAITNIEGIEKLPENLLGAANHFLETYNGDE